MSRKVRISFWSLVVKTVVRSFQALSLASLILVGCGRKESDQSRLVISIPLSLSGIAGSDPQVQAVTGQLRYMVINIRNQQGALVINQNWEKHDNYGYIPDYPVFNLERGFYTVQFLGVYGVSESNHMEFAYGDFEKDFQLADESANISAYLVGSTDLEGTVGGRYLYSGGVSGPTGTLQGEFQPPQIASSLHRLPPPMAILSTQIFNGWFTVFALSGSATFNYRLLETNEILFSNLSLESSELLSKARYKSPASFSWYSGSNYARSVESRRFVLGYFGAGSGSICHDSAPVPISGLYNDSAHSIPLYWNPESCGALPNENVCRESGPATSCPASGTPFVDYLKFYPANIDRHEGSAFGMQGPFKILTSGNFLSGSYSNGSLNLSWSYLPGVSVESGILGGVDLFVNSSSTSGSNLDGGGPNGFDCRRLLDPYQNMGYNYVGTASSAPSFSIPNVTESSVSYLRVVLCPFRFIGAEKKYYSTILRSDSCLTGNCDGGNTGGGGNAGGGGGSTATKVALRGAQAITSGQCARLELSLLNDQNYSASLTQDVTVNLAATGTTPEFFSNSGCTGPITNLLVPTQTSWMSIYFKTGNASSTNINLTPSVTSPALTSVTTTLPVVGTDTVAQLNFNPAQQAANVGTCLSIQIKTTETNGTPVSSSGDITITASGAMIYSNSSCSTTTSSVSLVSGIGQFYIKASTVGWASLQANATINSINFTNHYGISIVASDQPTKLMLSIPDANYLYLNQCMPIAVTLANDSSSPRALGASMTSSFYSTNGGAGNNFYTDAACGSQMTSYQMTVGAGTTSFTIYFKPQNTGTVTINSSIQGGNYNLKGEGSYTIGSLWMHVIANGFNGSWYDTQCRSLTFQLMNNLTAGFGAAVPNLSGSPVGVTMNTQASTADGGLYLNADCSDSISPSRVVSIAAGATTHTIYMKSLRSSGNYLSVSPDYTAMNPSTYLEGNTLSSMSYVWCPPMDGGGACPSSLSITGGSVVLFSPAVTVGTSMDRTVTISDSAGSGVTLSTFTISGGQSLDYQFKGGIYPGTGGTCGSSIAPSGSCTVVVTFSPSATGSRYAYLNVIYSSGYNSGVTIPLSLQGTGQ